MRLLNASTLKLHEFSDRDIPRYAILSHRWEESEVTFKHLSDGNGPAMSGWGKIEGCCAQALSNGWGYVWIDTCCIDKTSSAELSEAINSMFAWYKNSEWFTRGWTLQELLAPRYVDFFSRDWDWIGSKSTLDELIRSVTRITHLWDYMDASVAQKMSWAAGRKTTRIEDRAYSLLGLFGVYIPPLYGEKENAFIRLQLEIISKTDDDSIFAWEDHYDPKLNQGLLASSPVNFTNSFNIVKISIDRHRPPHVMTSKGLGVHFMLKPIVSEWSSRREHLALLNCMWTNVGANDDSRVVGLPLYDWEPGSGLESWSRGVDLRPFEIDPETKENLNMPKIQQKEIFYIPYIEAKYSNPERDIITPRIRFHGASLSCLGFWERRAAIRTLNYWSLVDLDDYRLNDPNNGNPYYFALKENHTAFIIFENDDSQNLGIVLGISDNRFWVDIVILKKPDSLDNIKEWIYLVCMGQDRVPLPFHHGYINARISTPGIASIAEVSFGEKLLWPQRDGFGVRRKLTMS